MASKAVASGANFMTKLLRLHAHQCPNLVFRRSSLVGRSFCSAPPPLNPTGQGHQVDADPNPFLRTGEAGPCRVDKTKSECHMRVDVPGIAEEDMQVWVEPGFIYFHARGSRLPQYNYEGRVFGGSISFNPDRYDSSGVKAEVKNGILWLVVPRVEN